MKKNFVTIKCVSPEIALGNICHNADCVVCEMEKAERSGVGVLLLPELCLCGYTMRDYLSTDTLLESCAMWLGSILSRTAGLAVTAVVGLPVKCKGEIYSCAVVISRGRILGAVPKSSFMKKSVFGEIRVFDKPRAKDELADILGFSNVPFGTELVMSIDGCDAKIGCVLGEARENAPLLIEKGANIIVNPTAQPVFVGSTEDREYIARELSYNGSCVVAMCNAGENESTSDAIFSTHNIVCQNGKILAEEKPFESKTGESVAEIDLNSCEKSEAPIKEEENIYSPCPFVSEDMAQRQERCKLILTMQGRALARRLTAIGSKTMILGISGGLDSTLALLGMVECADYLGWDRKSIIAITMPCFGTTKRTKSNAVLLSEAFGVDLREIDISEVTRIHLRDISHDESNRNVTYENAQARERTQILMDVANDTNGIVVGTGDLSEAALGWSTFNGDHMAMYNLNSDIPKTLVRQIVGCYADTCENKQIAEILLDILDTPVSPELLPANEKGEIKQKTEDLVGPYLLHDFFLYNFVHRGLKPSQLYKNAKIAFDGYYDEETIYKWLCVFLKKFITQQFKRSCSPEGVKVCPFSLSPRGEFNAPSDISYAMLLEELNNNK